MAGYPMLTIELTLGSNVLYLSTHGYITSGIDTPANQQFEPRLIDDVGFDKSVGCVLWGSKSRGAQNFGVIKIANADGEYDSYAEQSFRDATLTILRGESDDDYSTFTTVANLIVDRLDFSDENVFAIYVTDNSARLETTLQQDLYPATVSNQVVRQQPRPIAFGRCHQVPLVQPDAYGNGRYDIHDSDNWIGVEQVLDAGATLVEGSGYERSKQDGIYGIERLTAVQGGQTATVLGQFAVLSTAIDETFSSLASWTEANGGVGGRDMSIVSSALSIINTLGGATLSLTWNASTPTGDYNSYWYYEFDCTQYTSGYAELRTESGGATHRRIDGLGRYNGVIRAAGNVVPAFYAPNGSNCSLRVDNFILRQVYPLNTLEHAFYFLATDNTLWSGHGPLDSGDLDIGAISALSDSLNSGNGIYQFGFHVSQPVQIADMLDQLMGSIAGWWYVNRLGQLTVGRLEEPSGTPEFEFDVNNIVAGMSIEFDGAKGLSNRALGKRNWQTYNEGELVTSLQYVQLNPYDKDADITIAGNGYTYSSSGPGSLRSTPIISGGRYYFEMTVTAQAVNTHYAGVASSSASLSSAPGFSDFGIGYRATGGIYQGSALIDTESSFTTNDVIGVAIDGRAAAGGSRSLGYRVYFSLNGTWQNSAILDAESGFYASANNATGIAYAMFGSGAAGSSGSVNFGQSTFAYDVPNDYMAYAWHRTLLLSNYRDVYQSATALAASYEFATASESAVITQTTDDIGPYVGGIPTLLTRRVDLAYECDRWCDLYSVERFFYKFDVLLNAVDADQLEPGDLISVTYPRFGLTSKLLRVIGVRGKLLDAKFTITAWG